MSIRWLGVILGCMIPFFSWTQDNYEIQVYASPTVGKDTVIHYYKDVGSRYSVNPFIYPGIHTAATPLFAGALGWILYNRPHRQPIGWPGF